VNAPSSLFVFLHRQLRLSKGAASYRATAAALIQRIPEVVEPLRDGLLCLSTIFEIAKVLTPENRTEVLPGFFHRSKTEARRKKRSWRPGSICSFSAPRSGTVS
jgi:hypothetical protein